MVAEDAERAGSTVYKIVESAAWQQAIVEGFYGGSADDRRDGFIHLSTARQLEGTARKHFSGRENLLLVAFDAAALGSELRWEASRGGALFPHFYAPLRVGLALWSRSLSLDVDDVPNVAQALAANVSTDRVATGSDRR
ncbi:MAG: DUF952 domain-containing protein [Hyphomicrobiaceae bacterium]|nr:DUF952 domain-containing protein [Hyphomicrobiaceae bacterium]